MTTGFQGYLRLRSSCAALNVTLSLHLAIDKTGSGFGCFFGASKYRTTISHIFHAVRKREEKGNRLSVLYQNLTLSCMMCAIFKQIQKATLRHVFHGLTFVKHGIWLNPFQDVTKE